MAVVWVLLVVWPVVCQGTQEMEILAKGNYLSLAFNTSELRIATQVNEESTTLLVTVRGKNWFRNRHCFYHPEELGRWQELLIMKRGVGNTDSSVGSVDWSRKCSQLTVSGSATTVLVSSSGPGSVRVRLDNISYFFGSTFSYLQPYLRVKFNEPHLNVMTNASDEDTALIVTVNGDDWIRSKQCTFGPDEVCKWQKLEIVVQGDDIEGSSFGRLNWTKNCSRLIIPESTKEIYLSNGGPGRIRYKFTNESDKEVQNEAVTTEPVMTTTTTTPTTKPILATPGSVKGEGSGGPIKVYQAIFFVIAAIAVSGLCVTIFICFAAACYWKYMNKKQNRQARAGSQLSPPHHLSGSHRTTHTFLEMSQSHRVGITSTHEPSSASNCCGNGGIRNEPPTPQTRRTKSNVYEKQVSHLVQTQAKREAGLQESSEHIYEDWLDNKPIRTLPKLPDDMNSKPV